MLQPITNIEYAVPFARIGTLSNDELNIIKPKISVLECSSFFCIVYIERVTCHLYLVSAHIPWLSFWLSIESSINIDLCILPTCTHISTAKMKIKLMDIKKTTASSNYFSFKIPKKIPPISSETSHHSAAGRISLHRQILKSIKIELKCRPIFENIYIRSSCANFMLDSKNTDTVECRKLLTIITYLLINYC